MTPEHASELAAKVCALAPVVPVLVVDDASIAGALAQALVDGGLPALEVTLRRKGAQSDRRANPTGEILPNGRCVFGQCERLSQPVEHCMRRWQLGCPQRFGTGQRLGRHHGLGR